MVNSWLYSVHILLYLIESVATSNWSKHSMKYSTSVIKTEWTCTFLCKLTVLWWKRKRNSVILAILFSLCHWIIFVFAKWCYKQHPGHWFRIAQYQPQFIQDLLIFAFLEGEKKSVLIWMATLAQGLHVCTCTILYLQSKSLQVSRNFIFSLHTLKMRRLNSFCQDQRPSLRLGHCQAPLTSHMYCLEHLSSAGQKWEKIVQGRAHPKRDIVDTPTHASCATWPNTTKQTAFPTTWGKAERAWKRGASRLLQCK